MMVDKVEIPAELLNDLHNLKDKFKKAGVNFVAVASKYGSDSVDFGTVLSIVDDLMTERVLCDVTRQMYVEWSNATHDVKLKWEDE